MFKSRFVVMMFPLTKIVSGIIGTFVSNIFTAYTNWKEEIAKANIIRNETDLITNFTLGITAAPVLEVINIFSYRVKIYLKVRSSPAQA